MRFSSLAVTLLSALPLLGGIAASPIASPDIPSKYLVDPDARAVVPLAMHKRGSIVDVVLGLKSDVAGPIATLKNPTITALEAQTALQSIVNSISAASSQVPLSTAKRAIGAANGKPAKRQGTADDLETVGEVLAEIITDLLEAISGLADDLKALPLIGALIIAIDGGLNTLLLGVEIVLVGVIQILQGLLIGISGLLASLGGGLLAGLLFGL